MGAILNLNLQLLLSFWLGWFMYRSAEVERTLRLRRAGICLLPPLELGVVVRLSKTSFFLCLRWICAACDGEFRYFERNRRPW